MPAKVKICGLKTLDNAYDSAEAGATYLGFIVESKSSPRSITIHEFARIAGELKKDKKFGELFKIVAVIQDLPEFKIQNLIDLGLADILQFHGHEEPITLSKFYFQIEIWKAIETDTGDIQSIIDKLRGYKNVVHRFLLDVSKTGGNNFNNFEVYRAAENLGFDLAIAGGINLDNLRNIFDEIDPEVIDVCSGVEQIIGQKDPQKIQDFIIKVRNLSRF